MKKIGEKVASALLMLNLMSVGLDAATFEEIEPADKVKAATKIHLFCWDKILNQAMGAIGEEASKVRERIENDPVFAEDYIRGCLGSLNESSDLKSIAKPLVFFSNARDLDTLPYLQEYQAYLDRQIAAGNSIKRQWASSLRAILAGLHYNDGQALGLNEEEKIAKIDEIKTLVRETISSDYPFFRWSSYEQLFDIYRNFQFKDQAFDELIRGIELPGQYHSRVYQKLSSLDYSEDYSPKREFFLKKSIKIGTPREKAEASFFLGLLYQYSVPGSIFYRPQDALRIYQSLLSETELMPFCDNVDEVRLQMALVFSYDSGEIRNEDKAIEIYEEIIAHKETSSGRDYGEAVTRLLPMLKHSDPLRAVSLAREALENPRVLKTHKQLIESYLAWIYREGGKGVRNHPEAVRILEKRLINNSTSSDERLYDFRSLADLLSSGESAIRNMERAVQIFEDIRGNSVCNRSVLQSLSAIYEKDPVYKNLLKAADCYEELVPLCESPSEQLMHLNRLLRFYSTPGVVFDAEKAKITGQRILDHPAADESARLGVRNALSGL